MSGGVGQEVGAGRREGGAKGLNHAPLDRGDAASLPTPPYRIEGLRWPPSTGTCAGLTPAARGAGMRNSGRSCRIKMKAPCGAVLMAVT